MNTNDRISMLVKRELDGFSGETGIVFRSLDTDYEYAYQADKLFSTASSIKIFILGALLKSCEAESLSLKDTVILKETDKAGGSGVLKELDAGLILSVKDIATLMIIESDNTASNMLIDILGGVDAVNSHIGDCGLKFTRLNRKISSDANITAKSEFGTGTPREFTDYLAGISEYAVFNKNYTEIFYQILGKQRYRDFFPRYLPLKPYFDVPGDAGIHVANKTGFYEDKRSDTGYVFLNSGKKRYVYAVFTEKCRDLSYRTDNEASLLLARLGKLFYEREMLRR